MPPLELYASMSDDAQSLMETTAHRISADSVLQIIWQTLFTEAEQKSLGGDLLAARQAYRDAAHMWCKLHPQSSLRRAIIELGKQLNFLTDLQYQWLLREAGETRQTPTANRPVWNPETGELRLDGKVIRKVRLLRHPSKVQVILEAFEAAGWTERIARPTRVKDTSEALRTLNSALKRIKFHSQEGGAAIGWAPLKPQ